MKLIRLLIASVLVAGCEGMPRAPVEEDAATAEAGYGRAFGRIDYRENGKDVLATRSFLNSVSLTLFTRSIRTGKTHFMQVEGDGSFYWPLEAGEYAILAFRLTRAQGAVSTSTGRLMTTFAVPSAGQAIYIGDLQIERGASGYRLRVADRYEEALGKAQDRLSAAKQAAAKGLMRLEAQIGSYKRMIAICHQSWGLACDSTHQGLEPLKPEGAGDGFPVTQNLTPSLEWKPASRPGLTYDVAIFESVPLNPAAIVHTAGLRGALVAYAEGVREPRHLVVTPLEPAKLYQWTVRLRDGDTVSNWSTISRSTFAVVAWSRGSGQMFGLATPAGESAR
jgi:hypothetical protein